MSQVLTKYAAELEFRGLARASRYRYIRIARMYLKSDGDFTRESVQQFVVKLNGQGTYKRWAFDALRGFFEVSGEPWPFKTGEGPRRNDAFRPHFTVDQAEALLKLTKHNPLHYAVIRLDCLTGARRVELAGLLLSDYDPPLVRIQAAKTRDITRTLELDQGTMEAINRWLEVRGKAAGPLFCKDDGRPLRPDDIGAFFREYRRRMGLPERVGIHALRRGVTTWLHSQGFSVIELKEWGGWKSTAMPSLYVQLDLSEVAHKAAARNPIATGGN